MTLTESYIAEDMLRHRCDRLERGQIYGSGYYLTAYWNDGSGQRLFYNLRSVAEWSDDQTAIRFADQIEACDARNDKTLRDQATLQMSEWVATRMERGG